MLLWLLVLEDNDSSLTRCVPRACVSMLLQFHGARKHGGKLKALLKRSVFLTKPLILGIGASRVLPRRAGRGPLRGASYPQLRLIHMRQLFRMQYLF